MDSNELRKRFFAFFKERGHAIVPSSSLLPTDPSVLLTTAGMQQFKPYFIGKADPIKDFGSKNTASIQKSFRTSDIDEVGDERHLTFFEMMGNFSFGGYFKKEAIQYTYDFIVKDIGLKIDYVSVFGGDANVPADEESEKIWKSIDSSLVVKKFGRADNFWGPTGNEGPCGPCTEIYVDGIEIWNIVFNQYFQHQDKTLEPLKTPGVDTGMGLERLAMVSQGKENIFQTDLFEPLINVLPTQLDEKVKRIIADHMRATVFLISDGVRPSNKEAGYVLRKLIRRIVLYVHRYELDEGLLGSLISEIIENYRFVYPDLEENKNLILLEFKQEQNKFKKLLIPGLAKIRKLVQEKEKHERDFPYAEDEHLDFGSKSEDFSNLISGKEAFDIYQSFGIPPELIQDELAQSGHGFHKEEFKKALEEATKKHQEISRAGQERKFGGHGLLLDTGELKAANEEELKIVTRLHTTTHLLQASLRKVLGDSVHQAGSDITAERTRFDFTFDRKLTADEIKKVEDLISQAIQKNLSMGFEQIPFKEAIESGALYSPKEKYPEIVKVYTAKDQKTGEVFSKELCGGPHITHTGEIGSVKIIKEESASAGIRRIRVVLA